MYQEMYKDRDSTLRWAFLARRIVCISDIQGGAGFGFCLTAEAFRGGLLERTPSNQGQAPGLARLRRVPSLRRRSVGPPPSAIHGRGRLSRHPCRSAHCASPAFSLHPSRVWWCLGYRVQGATRAGANALRFLGSCIYLPSPPCRSALARDLPGTGSKPCACGVPDTIESPDFATATRQIAGKRAPTASGQNQTPRPHLNPA
jgi:hypothetical protein